MNLLDRLRLWFSNKQPKVQGNNNPVDFYSLVDMGFSATWDKQTGQAIKKRMQAMREGKLSESQAFTFLCLLDDVTRRKYEDKTIDYHKYQGLIPLQGSYKYDKLTSYGLSVFCGLAVQKASAIPPTHMAAGDGTGDTEDYSDILVHERSRYSFSEGGYFNSLNKTIRYNMTFDILEPTYDVTEIGLFNNGSNNVGPMISRTTFDNPIEHVYAENYFTVSYLIIAISA